MSFTAVNSTPCAWCVFMTFRPRPPEPRIPITILSLAPRTRFALEKTAGAARAPTPRTAERRRKDLRGSFGDSGMVRLLGGDRGPAFPQAGSGYEIIACMVRSFPGPSPGRSHVQGFHPDDLDRRARRRVRHRLQPVEQGLAAVSALARRAVEGNGLPHSRACSADEGRHSSSDESGPDKSSSGREEARRSAPREPA